MLSNEEILLVVTIIFFVILIVVIIVTTTTAFTTTNNIIVYSTDVCVPIAQARSELFTPTGLRYNYIDRIFKNNNNITNISSYNNAVGWMIYNRSCSNITMTSTFDLNTVPLLANNDNIKSNSSLLWTNYSGIDNKNSVLYAQQPFTISTIDGTKSTDLFASSTPSKVMVIIVKDDGNNDIKAEIFSCSTNNNVFVPSKVTC